MTRSASGLHPLKAHVRDCDDCRAQVDEARFVVDALEDVPHFAPSHTLRRPGDGAGAGLRALARHGARHRRSGGSRSRGRPASRSAALATSAASVLTVGDPLDRHADRRRSRSPSGAAGDQVRGLVYDAGREVLATVFGDQMFAIIQQTGTLGIAAALLGLAAAAGGSIAGLRALAAAPAAVGRSHARPARIRRAGARESPSAGAGAGPPTPTPPPARRDRPTRRADRAGNRRSGAPRATSYLPDADNFTFGDRIDRGEHVGRRTDRRRARQPRRLRHRRRRRRRARRQRSRPQRRAASPATPGPPAAA